MIDTNSTLRLIDIETKQVKPEYTNFKRSDVWNVVWATDNPETFVSMEKTKMYIFRDTEPEVSCFILCVLFLAAIDLFKYFIKGTGELYWIHMLVF